MSMRIVDNQKIDMTDSEWEMYNRIVKSYTTLSNKGEDLFQGLFKTDDNGIIQFLIPPSRHQTSLEVFLYLASLMQHQHLRVLYNEVESICAQMKAKMQEIDAKLAKLETANKDQQ